ncbi:MAG TPA: hypothetical protein VJ777_07215, partial [Mycobacterium sp.]|nr:hypothetical protein [Mycobacterium sp.]
SATAFVGVEAIQHMLLGERHGMPAALLLVGVGVHGLAGAVTALFWLCYTESVQDLIAPRRIPGGPSAARIVLAVPVGRYSDRDYFVYSILCRAPPVAATV